MIRKFLAAAGVAAVGLLAPAATAQQPAFDLVVARADRVHHVRERVEA